MASTTSKIVKIIQLLLFILGILTIAVGFYSSGPRLIQFIADYLSVDKSLSPDTISALNGIGNKIIIAGILLVVFSLLLKYITMLWDYITRKIQSTSIIGNFITSIGRIFSFIYRVLSKEKILLGIATVILLGFLIPSIFLNPNGGFHVEGINLQPPKNLAVHGKYATLSTEGFDEYTYRISAGPGILLPDALVFKIFGVNVYYVRALYTLFVLLAALMFYRLAKEMYNKKVAILTLFLLIPLLPLTGNQAADAYIPALFYFLVGAHYWFKSIENKKNTHLVLGGLFWGLSFQTQWLFLFAIFAVIVTCIILHFADKGLKSKYYLTPILMVILVTMAWTVFRVLNVGIRQEVHHLYQFWGTHGHRAIGTSTEIGAVSSLFSIIRPIESLVQIDVWRDFQFFLTIPAIIYLIILIHKNKWIDFKSLFFLNFTIIWFLWWLFFNFDLPETHFLIIEIMSILFVAKLLYDIWEYSLHSKNNFVDLATNKEIKKESMIFYLVRIIIICLVIGKTTFPLFGYINDMYKYNNNLVRPYHEMISYIDKNTEKDAIFSGWGWSMPWYVDLNNNIDRIIKDRTIFPLDQREKVPEYFIVSPEWPLVKVTDEWPSVIVENKWSKKSNDLRKKFLKEDCTLLKTFGREKFHWLLYKVNNEKNMPLSNNNF